MVKYIFPFILLISLIPISYLTAGDPLPGQIIVDPQNPQWLKYQGGDPFFMCGPGDPEGFLYRGTRNADGTRNGDQMTLINKMIGTGANCIYLMAVRSHGGDGGSDENPFINSDPGQGFDTDILDQWETWFARMDDNGIVIFFIFYDDGAGIWNTGDVVGPEEQNFIHTIVNYFEHHKHLIWCIAEEYQERYSAKRVSNIAAEIKAADDHNHVVAVHKLSGLDFSEFANDPSIDQFAIQYNKDNIEELHSGMVTAWNNAAGRYNLNMSEIANGGIGSGTEARKKSWAMAMGGAYVMQNGMDIKNTSVSDLEDCGRLRQFFEMTNINKMAPHDELKFGETKYVLAAPDIDYILYSDVSGNIGIQGLSAGTYNLLWFDPVDGDKELVTAVNLAAGNQSLNRPSSIGNEVVLYLKRIISDSSPPPVPTGLNAAPVSEFQINLAWNASNDPESGISNYNLYRSGNLIAQPSKTSYSDTGLSENTTYSYEVSAVNGVGLESGPGTTVSVTTLADKTPPTILSTGIGENLSEVILTFSEPVEQTSATNVSNYNIDNGITIFSASLSADLRSVILNTSPHSEGITYNLTVNNVLDRASNPNPIAPNTRASYTISEQVNVTNLTVTSGKPYEVIYGLNNGDPAYIDRSYIYSNIPDYLTGNRITYIKTANADKLSEGVQFLSFEVNKPVKIHIAHDDRYQLKPDWLSDFSSTGQKLFIESAQCTIYEKAFAAGLVTLGGNIDPAERADNNMYTVIITGQGTSSALLDPPTGLRILK